MVLSQQLLSQVSDNMIDNDRIDFDLEINFDAADIEINNINSITGTDSTDSTDSIDPINPINAIDLLVADTTDIDSNEPHILIKAIDL